MPDAVGWDVPGLASGFRDEEKLETLGPVRIDLPRLGRALSSSGDSLEGLRCFSGAGWSPFFS